MPMESTIKKKHIRSLAQKKYRDRWSMFVAEGPRLVNDLMRAGMIPHLLFTTDLEAVDQHELVEDLQLIADEELKKLSLLKTPQKMVAVFEKPQWPETDKGWSQGITLCLDGVQDPGNLGTIMRLADWFGLSQLVCSPDSADVFNPKVVQASMGAIARVEVIYTSLADYCRAAKEKHHMPVYGTFMEGENLYRAELPSQALIIMGNEGTGIRPETESEITHRLSIPAFREQACSGMESLNVGVASAIICSEFYRQKLSRDYSK